MARKRLPARSKRTGRFLRKSSRPKKKAKARKYKRNPPTKRNAMGQFRSKPAATKTKSRATRTKAGPMKYKRNPPMSPMIKVLLTAAIAAAFDALLARVLPTTSPAIKKWAPAVGKLGIGFTMSRKPKTAIMGRALLGIGVYDAAQTLMAGMMTPSVAYVPTLPSESAGYIDMSGLFPRQYPKRVEPWVPGQMLDFSEEVSAGAAAEADEAMPLSQTLG